jgi:hypothetical protein
MVKRMLCLAKLHNEFLHPLGVGLGNYNEIG